MTGFNPILFMAGSVVGAAIYLLIRSAYWHFFYGKADQGFTSGVPGAIGTVLFAAGFALGKAL